MPRSLECFNPDAETYWKLIMMLYWMRVSLHFVLHTSIYFHILKQFLHSIVASSMVPVQSTMDYVKNRAKCCVYSYCTDFGYPPSGGFWEEKWRLFVYILNDLLIELK